MPTTFAFRATLAVSLLCLSGLAVAAPTPAGPAKVMLVGMFHFANPGRDMVKSRVINVMAPPNQAYLDGLAARLATFRPTDVLIQQLGDFVPWIGVQPEDRR